MAEARKTVTVVFSDVAGSTNLGERLDPEAVRHVMGRWFSEAAIALERHGGTVEKFIGDAAMAVFGIPTLREDDALRAVRAAAELHERIARLNEELERELGVTIAIRTGVNTGEVVAGDPREGQAFATGDAVNVAARLQQTAAPGEIVLGETTFALVRGAVRAEPLEPLELKGKAQPVGALRLLEVFAGAPAFTRRLDAPFVGREDELAALVAALDDAERENACRLVTVVGAPGIGKSRLVRELLTATKGRARAVIGRCLSYGEGITYWPLADIVRQVGGDDPRAFVAELVGGDDAELVGERIAGAVGLLETTSRTEEIFWATRRLFESLARERPLVVVVDDIHWAEETLLDLLEYVVAFAHASVLLLCAARSDLFDARPSWAAPRPGSTLVSLEPLTEAESEELAEALGAQRGTASHVVEVAEGNPLFLEQLLALEAENGRETGRRATPPTIQALLGARIDRLEENERTVLERAAVEGRLFHLGAVAELLPDDRRAAAGSSVLSLVRKELVRPDESLFPGDDGFRFAHILVRDVAYDGMPKAVRAEAHERFAAWLERKAGVRITEYEEILAYHLEQAASYSREVRPGDPRTETLARAAADRLTAAGRRASARGDFAAVINLLTRARELLPEQDVARLELVSDLGNAFAQTGMLTEAEALYVQTIEDARRLRRERPGLMAEIDLAELRIQTDPARSLDEALTLAQQSIHTFKLAGDEQGLARAWKLVHEVHWVHGHLSDARQAAERGLLHAERADDLRLQANLRAAVGGAIGFGFTPVDECLVQLEQAIEWYKATGSLAHQGSGLNALGQLRLEQGRLEEGLALCARARVLLDELGMRVTWAGHTGAGSWSLGWLVQDPEASEQLLRASYETLKDVGDKGTLSTVASNLAHILYMKGAYDEAERLTLEAEETGASEDVATEVGWRNARAMLLARRGRHAEAETLARQALEKATATEYFKSTAHSYLALGEVLHLEERPLEAIEAFQEALHLYEAKGYELSADAVRARLRELQAPSPSS